MTFYKLKCELKTDPASVNKRITVITMALKLSVYIPSAKERYVLLILLYSFNTTSIFSITKFIVNSPKMCAGFLGQLSLLSFR